MIIKTSYGIDCWDDHNTGETVYMPHIPPVNNCTVTVAYQRDNGEYYPFDWDDETLQHAMKESGLSVSYPAEYLTLDTETGLLTFFNGSGEEEQQLTILPNVLNLIKENLEADPTALPEWNKRQKEAVESFIERCESIRLHELTKYTTDELIAELKRREVGVDSEESKETDDQHPVPRR